MAAPVVLGVHAQEVLLERRDGGQAFAAVLACVAVLAQVDVDVRPHAIALADRLITDRADEAAVVGR